MKSLTFTRGVALSVASFLLLASSALADRAAPLLSSSALAAQTGENTKLNLGGAGSGSHTATSGTGSSIIRTLVALLVVIAVIYGIAWILKQFKGGRSRASGKGLEQVATLPLSGGRSVSLVRVGNELLLLGVAEQSVTALHRYSELEAVEAGLRIDAIDADSELLISDDPVLANERLALPVESTSPRMRPGLPMPRDTKPTTATEFAGRFVESLRALTVRR
jgi:flagellar protein FliO/FliZ